MHQTLRFKNTPRSPFAGQLIDRQQKIAFTLNGRQFSGFMGDNVVSALLANGVTHLAGTDGNLTRLTFQNAPQICSDKSPTAETDWHSSAQYRVNNGDILFTEERPSVSFKVANWLKLASSLSSLGVSANPNPVGDIFDCEQLPEQNMENLIVGGGIAGMQAALNLANSGETVFLVEKLSTLGGMCDYYGRAEDEQTPCELLEQLVNDVVQHKAITVLERTAAIDISDARVLLHSNAAIIVEGTKTKLFWAKFNNLVLAVGSDYSNHENSEFYLHAADVFRLAVDYGVMPAKTTSIVTGGNSGFRLAMLLAENGVHVDKVYDKRQSPHSRHIDFAKALGVKMQFGTAPTSITLNNGKAIVGFSTINNEHQLEVKHTFEDLIVSDAPLPNLNLWKRAGGRCSYDEQTDRILPVGNTKNVALIGSASGAISQSECLASANDVSTALMGNSSAISQNYKGLFKYESPPSALTFGKYEDTLELLTTTANAPGFLGTPSEEAVTEFNFERTGLNQSIGKLQKTAHIRPFANGVAVEKITPGLVQGVTRRFKKSMEVELIPDEGIRMKAGQYVYDADGVNETPLQIGVTIGVNERHLIVIVETAEFEIGDRLFVKTRSGLIGATVAR